MSSGVSLDVRSNIERTVVEFRGVSSAVKNKAVYRALNRALDKVATETGREIRKVYNVKQKAITSALTKRKANSASLFARLIVEGVRLGLIEFQARAVNPWNVKGRKHVPGGGVSVKIKVGGARKLIRGAFIARNTRTGYLGVWHRVGKERSPMVNLRSISVPQAFANEAVINALQLYAVETFDKNLAQQLRFLTGAV